MLVCYRQSCMVSSYTPCICRLSRKLSVNAYFYIKWPQICFNQTFNHFIQLWVGLVDCSMYIRRGLSCFYFLIHITRTFADIGCTLNFTLFYLFNFAITSQHRKSKVMHYARPVTCDLWHRKGGQTTNTPTSQHRRLSVSNVVRVPWSGAKRAKRVECSRISLPPAFWNSYL